MSHIAYLVDVVTWDGVIKSSVEIIQQFDDLYRTSFRRQRGEPDDIREVDRHTRIHLWSHAASCLQLLRNVTIMTAINWNITLTRMWANAQRDGRPVEYRWRHLFNTAKFGWRPLLEYRAVTRWNLRGAPNSPTVLGRYWAEGHHIIRTCGGDIDGV